MNEQTPPVVGRKCTLVSKTADCIVFKYNDGSAETADHDLSTMEGLWQFAAFAEKLGFGHRREIASQVGINPEVGVLLPLGILAWDEGSEDDDLDVI